MNFSDVHFIYVQIIFYREFNAEGLFLNEQGGLWQYALFQFHAWLLFASLRRLLSTLFLTGAHGFSVNAMLYIIPRQMLTCIEEIKRRRPQQNIFSTCHRLRRFLAQNAAYIRLLGDSNRLYGTAVFRFFLVAYPQNAHLLMSLLLEGREDGDVQQTKRSTSFKATVIVLLAQQQMIIFLMHVFSVQLATSVHKPVQPMTALFLGSLQSNLKFSFRIRLKMAAYLQHFNTDNRYGLSYGKVGAVTYSSFGKSLVFYWKFLIFAYKLFS